MAVMYTCMVLGLAELSSALPVAGAGYGFARRALGPLGGFATGTAILIEYAVAPAAIVIFIGGYVEALGLFGLTNSWPVYLVAYAIFVGIHLRGVGEALKVMFAITAVAVVGLVVFSVAMIPKFDVDKLFDIVPTDAAGASDFIPFGYAGVLAALVYGSGSSWRSRASRLLQRRHATPARTCPAESSRPCWSARLRGPDARAGARGFGLVGHGGVSHPLQRRCERPTAAIHGWPTSSTTSGWPAWWPASSPSSSPTRASCSPLSRAGYLPRMLSTTGKRHTPWVALIVPGTIGFLLAAFTEAGNRMIQIAVFGATVSYILMMVSHIVLRRREPGLDRPTGPPAAWRPPGSPWCSPARPSSRCSSSTSEPQ
jgi:ethanolamine permease